MKATVNVKRVMCEDYVTLTLTNKDVKALANAARAMYANGKNNGTIEDLTPNESEALCTILQTALAFE